MTPRMNPHDQPSRQVTVTSAQRFLIGVCVAAFPFILACAPVGTGLVRAAWVAVFLGVTAFVFARAARMKVIASESSVVVQNLGRDYVIPWTDVVSVDAGASNNASGLVTTLFVRRQRGRDVCARIASSYSSAKVERWREAILSTRP